MDAWCSGEIRVGKLQAPVSVGEGLWGLQSQRTHMAGPRVVRGFAFPY